MGLFPKQASKYVALMGIPLGPNSQVFVVDPQVSASGDGKSFEAPLKTLEEAYALCTANQNDTVVLVGGPTALNPAAAIDWAKSYTHLVGLSGDIPGVGQRCRIVGTAALDLSYVIDFQGDGCIVKNIQIYNGNDAAADSGAAKVTGARNFFKNVMFAGMAHATPGARAGCYSLNLSGEENFFEDCSIGLQTIIRAQSNAELLISGTGVYRNKFKHCEFLSWSVTAGKLLVKFAAGSVPWNTQFEDCLFNNLDMSAGGADGASIDNAIGDSSTAKHHIILRGKNMFVGCTGVADTVTNVFSAEGAPNAGFGLSLNPTT
ncbi:MAG: hypothetical protein CVU43_04515 [Chloroflexi bacterium HGW-Chloroflexi-5]|jgi:hypothetical protein|nr:MAG: hypothetical protein CVU43_04515 [Chloroflexi bacterium HGW-Chloroflexi-5]